MQASDIKQGYQRPELLEPMLAHTCVSYGPWSPHFHPPCLDAALSFLVAKAALWTLVSRSSSRIRPGYSKPVTRKKVLLTFISCVLT